jgi:hypothetical protein
VNVPEQQIFSVDTVFRVLVVYRLEFCESIVARTNASAYANQKSQSYKVLKVLIRFFAFPRAPHFHCLKNLGINFISRVLPIGHILHE